MGMAVQNFFEKNLKLLVKNIFNSSTFKPTDSTDIPVGNVNAGELQIMETSSLRFLIKISAKYKKSESQVHPDLSPFTLFKLTNLYVR